MICRSTKLLIWRRICCWRSPEHTSKILIRVQHLSTRKILIRVQHRLDLISTSTLCCMLHTTVWCAVNCFLQISASYCTSRYGCNIVDTRSPTMKTVYCILILVQHHPVANTQCNLNIEHFDPGATHCRDQMLHTLDCRSNSNHITCCKFGWTNQRETQRGTWGVNGTDVRLVRSKTR